MFVFMKLHPMLKISACDAWLAFFGIFGESFVSKSLDKLCKTNTSTEQRVVNKDTVEKEFFIHIIEICCNSGMLVKSYRYWLLNRQP